MAKLRFTEKAESLPEVKAVVEDSSTVEALETPVLFEVEARAASRKARRSARLGVAFLSLALCAVALSSLLAARFENTSAIDSGLTSYATFFSRDTWLFSLARARMAVGDLSGAAKAIENLPDGAMYLDRRTDLVKEFVGKCVEKREWKLISGLRKTYPELPVSNIVNTNLQMENWIWILGHFSSFLNENFENSDFNTAVDLVKSIDSQSPLLVSAEASIVYSFAEDGFVTHKKVSIAPINISNGAKKSSLPSENYIENGYERLMDFLRTPEARDTLRLNRSRTLIREVKLEEAEARLDSLELNSSKISACSELVDAFLQHRQVAIAKAVMELATHIAERAPLRPGESRDYFMGQIKGIQENWKTYEKAGLANPGH